MTPGGFHEADEDLGLEARRYDTPLSNVLAPQILRYLSVLFACECYIVPIQVFITVLLLNTLFIPNAHYLTKLFHQIPTSIGIDRKSSALSWQDSFAIACDVTLLYLLACQFASDIFSPVQC